MTGDTFVSLVSDRVKQLLSAEDFHHVLFEPIAFTGKKATRLANTFWHWTSDLIMPPLSSRMVLRYVDPRHAPFDGDYTRGITWCEGLELPLSAVVPQEPHYARSALLGVEPFDAALMFERESNWWDERMKRNLIISRRLQRFCIENKFKMNYIPVRIDEE